MRSIWTEPSAFDTGHPAFVASAISRNLSGDTFGETIRVALVAGFRTAAMHPTHGGVSLTEGGRLTVDLDDKQEVVLDIQPLPKKEGKAKPEPEEISSDGQ